MNQQSFSPPVTLATASVQGHADGLVGSYVAGWALAEPDLGSSRIVVRDGSGTVLATGLATRRRPDLGRLGFGRTDVGFRILVEDMPPDGHLHVLADGVELPNSPLAVGPALFDGHFEILRGSAVGWVRARTSRCTQPRITVRTADGHLVGTGRSREHVDPQDRHFARDLFEFDLDDALFGIREFVLTAYANDVPFATASGSLPIEGYLDVLTDYQCAGWLFSPVAPHRQPALAVTRDGLEVGRGRCNVERTDLREHHPTSWRSGFAITLDPPETREPTLALVSIRTRGGLVELFDGPVMLGSRLAFVSAGRRLARLAHQDRLDIAHNDRALLQEIIHDYLGQRRHGAEGGRIRALSTGRRDLDRPIDVLIPIYKGIEITDTCIRSILAGCGPADRVVLVADCPPEAAMAAVLEEFRPLRNVVLLVNETNRGFIGSVNRGLGVSRNNDVLLLNSDTRLFPGGLDELRRVLASDPGIGTVTAMSNNATIFSYPHPTLPTERLDDIGWDEVAEIALAANRGRAIDVPTGHGFCMLIRRELLDRVGDLNPVFGKGYGEENELCLRATDHGFRHVAAPGAFVEHRESVSFGDDKEALLRVNLPALERMYPEYTPLIMGFERTDPLREGRWAIDAERLRRARQRGDRFVMLAENWLGGGTGRAVRDIGELVGYDGRTEMRLSTKGTGTVELACERLRLKASFNDGESRQLVALLDQADVGLVIFHQMLGYTAGYVAALTEWSANRNAIAYIHDFYSICPRVTLLNAVGSYCGVQPSDICDRCVSLGGAHEADRLALPSVGEHRDLFGRFLSAMRSVIAPSRDAADRIRRTYPGLAVEAIPHPEKWPDRTTRTRDGDSSTIVLLGGIGPHKGADKLLELAQLAALTHPHLHFAVIGHTSNDEELLRLPNVSITGPYKGAELDDLLEEKNARVALFLHVWPETYSYTFSEAIGAGLLPVVPDIGAPAERVRETGWGHIFRFPMRAPDLLALLHEGTGASPGNPPSFDHSNMPSPVPRLRGLFQVKDLDMPAPDVAPDAVANHVMALTGVPAMPSDRLEADDPRLPSHPQG